MRHNACCYCNVPRITGTLSPREASSKKGADHGLRYHPDRQQHLVGCLHLPDRDPHLAGLERETSRFPNDECGIRNVEWPLKNSELRVLSPELGVMFGVES